MSQKKEKGFLRRKLLHKYRLVILNEDSFEEKLSLKLTRLNVFVLTSIFAILLITGTTFLIALTPLREYIPGYSSTDLRKKAHENLYRVDSLELALNKNNMMIEGIRKVLMGQLISQSSVSDSLSPVNPVDLNEVDFSPNRQDSLLRIMVAREDRYSLFANEDIPSNFVLYPPARGKITQDYDPKVGHYAVDISLVSGTPIKAVTDGTVIFAEWSSQTGYVIIIKHAKEMVSVYKHNGSLNKQQGDLVRAGEVVATSGNTGELSTGPHLHFELWKDGYTMNPNHFIQFE